MNALAQANPGLDTRGIDQLPSGRFRLRFRVAKKRINGVFSTLDDAISTRDAAMREIADERMVPVDGSSLRQLGPAFLRSRKGNRNIRTDRGRWERHIA